MSTLYVTEYTHAAVDQGRALPVGGGAPIITQNLAISGGAAVSAPFGAFTHLIRVHTDVICSVLVSRPGPTGNNAAQTDARMAASQTEYFGVEPGGFISVIQNS